MRGRKTCSENEKRLREKLAIALTSVIGNQRGAITQAARETGVSKQSLSLYMRGRATPTPETLRILCAKLRLRLDVEGAIITASDLPIRNNRRMRQLSLPLALTDAIFSVNSDQLQVEVLKRRRQSIDLKITIDFKSKSSKGNKRITGRTLAKAS